MPLTGEIKINDKRLLAYTIWRVASDVAGEKDWHLYFYRIGRWLDHPGLAPIPDDKGFATQGIVVHYYPEGAEVLVSQVLYHTAKKMLNGRKLAEQPPAVAAVMEAHRSYIEESLSEVFPYPEGGIPLDT